MYLTSHAHKIPRSLCPVLASVLMFPAAASLAAPPRGDLPMLLCDNSMIESVTPAAEFRIHPANNMGAVAPALQEMRLLTVINEAEDSWLCYGIGPDGGLRMATSRDGLSWQSTWAPGLPEDIKPESFAPAVNPNPELANGSKFVALAALDSSQGYVTLTSQDGRMWNKGAETTALNVPLVEGRTSLCWSEGANAFAFYYPAVRAGRRSIGSAFSADLVKWQVGGAPFENADGEDIWGATVFPLESQPSLFLALLTRTASGQGGPADICLALSRDGGRTFQRPSLEAWIRPGAGLPDWRVMSPTVFFRGKPSYASRVVALRFLAAGDVHEIDINRFMGLHVPPLRPVFPDEDPTAWNRTEIITRPFVISGNNLTLNVSSDSSGGFRCELLDTDNNPIPGYSLNHCIRSSGIGAGYTWVSVDPEKMQKDIADFRNALSGDHYGDDDDMVVAWRVKTRDIIPDRDTRMVWMDGDISELIGRTVKLRISAHGCDLYSFQTADRPPVAGETVITDP